MTRTILWILIDELQSIIEELNKIHLNNDKLLKRSVSMLDEISMVEPNQ